MITIEKNVPIPPRREKPTKYPFADMEPGDSFLVQVDKDNFEKKILSMRMSSRKYSKAHGGQFTTRIVEGGVRCWRTE